MNFVGYRFLTNRWSDSAVEPKTVIYREKSTGSWVAEIIDLDAVTVGKQLWRGVYESKEEAQRDAQIEICRQRKSS